MKISKFLKTLPALALVFPFAAFADYSAGIGENGRNKDLSTLTIEVKTSPTLDSDIFLNLGEMTNQAVTPINCSGGEIGGMIFKPGQSYTCNYKINDIELLETGIWFVHRASKTFAAYRLGAKKLVPGQNESTMLIKHSFDKDNGNIRVSFQIDKK